MLDICPGLKLTLSSSFLFTCILYLPMCPPLSYSTLLSPFPLSSSHFLLPHCQHAYIPMFTYIHHKLFLIEICSSHLRKLAVERFSFSKEAAWWSHLSLRFRKWIQIPCLQFYVLLKNLMCILIQIADFLLYICLHWNHCVLP